MATFNVSQFVAAPPDVVFRRASDFGNAATFISGIKGVEMLTDGPVRVGTRFRETRMMFKREATETMEVVAFDAPRLYVLAAENCGCAYRTEFRFTPSGQGTDVHMQFEARPLTLFARVMSVLMRPMMKSCAKMCAKDLQDVKASIESGDGAVSGGAPAVSV